MFRLGEVWNVLQSDLTSLAECDIVEVSIDGERVAVDHAAVTGDALENIKVCASSGIHFTVVAIQNATWSLEVIKEANPS